MNPNKKKIESGDVNTILSHQIQSAGSQSCEDMKDTLVLDKESVSQLVRRVGLDSLLDKIIHRMEQTIVELKHRNCDIPLRSGVHYETPDWGLLETMPAHFEGECTTVKLVGYHPSNPLKRSLPTILSTICSFDGETGHLRGIVDGTFLTAIRTGAASALVSRVLGCEDSKNLGLIGCGAQAVAQAHALSRVFDLNKIIGYDCDEKAAGSLAKRLAFLGIEVEVVGAEGVKGLLESSDLLVTATSSEVGAGPLFEDFDNREHLHVNAVGADFIGKFELPKSLLQRALVCPDFPEQCFLEGESQQLEPVEVGADFEEIIQNAENYKTYRDQLTVFDSTGWALEDYVVSELFFDLAIELNIGQRIEIESIPSDPLNPYSFLEPEPREDVLDLNVTGIQYA